MMSVNQGAIEEFRAAMSTVTESINELTLRARILKARERAYCGFGQASLKWHPRNITTETPCFLFGPDGHPVAQGQRSRPSIAFTCGGDGGGGG